MYIKCTNTIYINNLNEKVKIEELKKALLAVFSQFGAIVDIAASKNLKMRGQAFIAFKEEEGAISAVKSMQGFPLFDKPLKIQLAKSDSDCVAKLLGTYIKREKRISSNKNGEKKVKRTCQQADQLSPVSNVPIISSCDPTNMALTTHSGYMFQNLPSIALSVPPTFMEPPPNNILFLENLPPDTSQMMLSALFGKIPGFKEIRSVAGRPGIAFAEFENELFSEGAKNSLQGFRFGQDQPGIKISFAKK